MLVVVNNFKTGISSCASCFGAKLDGRTTDSSARLNAKHVLTELRAPDAIGLWRHGWSSAKRIRVRAQPKLKYYSTRHGIHSCINARILNISLNINKCNKTENFVQSK